MAINKRQRFRVLRRCGFRCTYCGRSALEVVLEIDHVIPRARGGSDDDSNRTAACFDCNRGKGVEPVGFIGWLHSQRLRDDPVGDLADDEERRLAGQLRVAHATRDALWAAWHAWREWRRGKPTRAVVAVRDSMLRAVMNAKSGAGVYLKRGVWREGTFYKYEEKL
jgi:HNH endonuclease